MTKKKTANFVNSKKISEKLVWWRVLSVRFYDAQNEQQFNDCKKLPNVWMKEGKEKRSYHFRVSAALSPNLRLDICSKLFTLNWFSHVIDKDLLIAYNRHRFSSVDPFSFNELIINGTRNDKMTRNRRWLLVNLCRRQSIRSVWVFLCRLFLPNDKSHHRWIFFVGWFFYNLKCDLTIIILIC